MGIETLNNTKTLSHDLFPPEGLLPEFTGRISNNSAPIGRDVTFTCNVKKLGNYKVSQK